MNMKKALPLIAIAALLPASCGKPVPVAQVEIDPRLVQLPFSQVQTVHLTWTPSGSIGDEKPTVFVHLLGSKQKVERTFDHHLPQRWRGGAPRAAVAGRPAVAIIPATAPRLMNSRRPIPSLMIRSPLREVRAAPRRAPS